MGAWFDTLWYLAGGYMGQLLVALHPDAGVNAAGFAAAWNADDDAKAVAAGTAKVEPAGPGQFIPGMELVVAPLQGNKAPGAIYEVLKGVLKKLPHGSAKPTEVLLSATPTDDLFAVIPTATVALPDPATLPTPAVPTARPKMVVLTGALMSVCWLSRECSPARWFDWDSQEWTIHTYVLFWLAGLSAILVVGPTTGSPRFAMLGIVFYRLQELMFATLDNALKLTDRARRPNPAYRWPTPLLLSLVSIIQVVLIFAVAYLILTGQNPAAFAHPPSSWFDAFFLSWISLPPLGGGATPLSTMARVLTIAEEATGLMLIVIAIGRFLAGPD
jgi:hypothetical protein